MNRGARIRTLAWMLTIVRSRALDHLRRADEALVHPDPSGLIAPLPDLAAEPAALGIAREAHDELHRALCRVEPIPRQLIALPFLRGLTHEEIAAHQGLPLGTVKSHIRRAGGGESWTLRDDAGDRAQMLRLAAGGRLTLAARTAPSECLLLAGEAFFPERLLDAGDYRIAPADGRSDTVSSDVGALFFLREDAGVAAGGVPGGGAKA